MFNNKKLYSVTFCRDRCLTQFKTLTIIDVDSVSPDSVQFLSIKIELFILILLKGLCEFVVASNSFLYKI